MQTIKIAGRLSQNGLATRLFGCALTFAWNYCDKFATSANKVYELRLYQMKPEHYRESLDLLSRYWAVRTAHSKDVGSWMTELGGICETVHLWEYDSLSDRIKRRQNVANDPVWRNDFLPKFFEKSLKLTCVLLKPRPGTEVITSFPQSESAVYELWNSEPDSTCHSSDHDEIVVGQFATVYGQTEGEFTLFRYADPDLAFERAFQRRREKNLQGSSRLLVPCQWSKIK